MQEEDVTKSNTQHDINSQQTRKRREFSQLHKEHLQKPYS